MSASVSASSELIATLKERVADIPETPLALGSPARLPAWLQEPMAHYPHEEVHEAVLSLINLFTIPRVRTERCRVFYAPGPFGTVVPAMWPRGFASAAALELLALLGVETWSVRRSSAELVMTRAAHEEYLAHVAAAGDSWSRPSFAAFRQVELTLDALRLPARAEKPSAFLAAVAAAAGRPYQPADGEFVLSA